MIQEQADAVARVREVTLWGADAGGAWPAIAADLRTLLALIPPEPAASRPLSCPKCGAALASAVENGR